MAERKAPSWKDIAELIGIAAIVASLLIRSIESRLAILDADAGGPEQDRQ